MRLPFPLVIINIQEKGKINYLITVRYAAQIPLRTEELIPWMSPSSFLWDCKYCNFTQGHLLTAGCEIWLMEGQLSNVIPAQKSSCPSEAAVAPTSQPSSTLPSLAPSLLHSMVPKKSPQNSLQTLFSKKCQIQYTFVTSFFKRIITKISESLNS